MVKGNLETHIATVKQIMANATKALLTLENLYDHLY
jgi:hypothetical protein